MRSRFLSAGLGSLKIAVIICAGLSACSEASPQDFQKDRQQAERLAAESGFRLVRFTAAYDGTVADRGEAPNYLPSGTVTNSEGDPLIAGEAKFSSVVQSNVDGKGGFIDRGTIELSNGTIRYEGVFPTHNDPTVVGNLRHTVMVESVKGGTGAFEGATGYLLINIILVPRAPKLTAFNGTVVGVLFVRSLQ